VGGNGTNLTERRLHITAQLTPAPMHAVEQRREPPLSRLHLDVLRPMNGCRVVGMAQVAALVAPAYEIDRGGGLLQLHLEGSHERIFGRHGHALAGVGDVEPNGECIVGHGIVSLLSAFRANG
jgi:hypothetical protein